LWWWLVEIITAFALVTGWVELAGHTTLRLRITVAALVVESRLPFLTKLAATTAFTEVTVIRYGEAAAISGATFTNLWPSVVRTRAVTVVLIRDQSQTG
jgi:hypothetical protein